MREIKFRAWDDENKKMYSPEELEQEGASELEKTIYGYLSFGAVLIYDFKNPRLLFILLLFFHTFYAIIG